MSQTDVDEHVEPPLDSEERHLCLICLHCYCWWSDYFWDEEANPLDEEVIDRWRNYLFTQKEISTFGDHGNKDANGHTLNDTKTYTPQEYLANALESAAKNIRAQPFRNRAEWEAGKHKFVCPKCGKQPQLCDRWDW